MRTETPVISNNISMNDDKKFIEPQELVSVGVPVRNGGDMLRHALDSIINQDYQNLEIIISDNDSTDNTALIALEFQERDSRITYHRQAKFLTALENLRFVLDQARGEYFMWAAHDDTRSLDYISQFVKAMTEDRKTIVSFGDLYISTSICSEGIITPYDFSTTGLSTFQRMKKTAYMSYHFYGLWRRCTLRNIRFYPSVWALERPIMVAAAYLGEFKYVPGPRFTYLVIHKSDLERAVYEDGKAGFNKYQGMLDLFRATYNTSAVVGGMLVGIVAVWFVAKPHIYHFPGFIISKIEKIIFNSAQHD